MVYVIVKEDLDEEIYENEKYIISHVSKNYSWIIDTGFSNHITSDIDKFHKLEEYDGRIFKLRNDFHV